LGVDKVDNIKTEMAYDFDFNDYDEEIPNNEEFYKKMILFLKKIIRELEKLKRYPKHGEEYRNVLYFQFISKPKKSISEVQEKLGIVNSQFFRLAERSDDTCIKTSTRHSAKS